MPRLIQKTISMPCHPKFLKEVRALLKETLSECDLTERKRDLLILAVDEAVSSVIQYAKYKGYDHEIALSIDINDVRFKATLNDSLNVFDLNGGLSDKQLAERVKRERSYSLGIFLMRQIMDEITYSYKKGFENTLELIAFL